MTGRAPLFLIPSVQPFFPARFLGNLLSALPKGNLHSVPDISAVPSPHIFSRNPEAIHLEEGPKKNRTCLPLYYAPWRCSF
jgi:hypothetical protein